MVRKFALAAALTATFAASAFAATTPARWFVTKASTGVCTAAQSATAPTGLVGSSKGYSNLTAANNEIAKLKKAKPPVCS